ncbi:uncharacterized protein DUF2530 [Knoellia remsis]|uniref:Uncharacterized protein DUF2530 n=1 Tax=Knoellia remsis TaxID=407159 RepID=A0A2T0U6D1_9MICO|nr:DUF2530 domain-containing protein [Knoellia remsis]PRY53467.1 uncharacterized protein DUF2530 [Knoellia remsis]
MSNGVHSDPGAGDARRAAGIPDDPADDATRVTDGEAEVLAAMDVPTQRIIVVGLAVWVVAFVVTLAVPALHEGDRSWWPWACVAGFALGLLGLLYVRRGRGNAALTD